MVKIFRVIVVVSTLLFICLWAFPFIAPSVLTEEEMEILMFGGFGGFVLSLFSFGILFTAWLVCSIGVFFFKPWARQGFLFLAIFSVVTSPFLGFLVYSPWEVTLMQLVTLADGAILALMYLSSVAHEFSTPNKLLCE